MLHLISFTLQSLESIYNYLHILVQFTNVVFPDESCSQGVLNVESAIAMDVSQATEFRRRWRQTYMLSAVFIIQ